MFRSPLARKFAIALLVKVVALFALWFLLIRPKFVHETGINPTNHLYASPALMTRAG